MDFNAFNLFIKMLREEYKLSEYQLQTVSRRLLADDKEFERVWKAYRSKSSLSGVDEFRFLLQDLLN